MKERGILFSAPMVRAILDGRKSQTRRVMKPQPFEHQDGGWHFEDSEGSLWSPQDMACPYGVPGDRLWAKETFAREEDDHGLTGKILYRADTDPADYGGCRFHDGSLFYGRWRPSIFMPRWASRIDLEVTEVRVQRLQEISEEDAKAEGANEMYERDFTPPSTFCFGFQHLWDSINSDRAPWSSNPFVWAISFKRVQPAGGAR